MRYGLSLKSETFTPEVEAFDRQMLVLLKRMRTSRRFLLARCKMDLHSIRCGPRLIMRLVWRV